MEDRVKLTPPILEPCEHEAWRTQVMGYYPVAVIQDDSSTSAFRERALNKGKLVGFFMRPHITGTGTGYVIHENG